MQQQKDFNNIVEQVKSYLLENKIVYELISLDKPYGEFNEVIKYLKISNNSCVRTLILQENDKLVMVVLPANYILDPEELANKFNTRFLSCNSQQIKNLFIGCKENIFPAIPGMYNIKCFFDKSLTKEDILYFETGDPNNIIKVSKTDFLQIHENSIQDNFSKTINNIESKFTETRMKKRIDETCELPIIPVIAHELIKLRVDPNADAINLAELIEKDPSLSAQLISWSKSSYYGYTGRIDSVNDAIVKVLGFDLVMNIALGIAIGGSLNIANDGPIGLKALWRHSIFCATLIDNLMTKVANDKKITRGLAYLCGLLHNIGFLLLGHMFAPQYLLLDKFIKFNSHLCISYLEKYTLGVDHQQMGAWLMKAWDMPEELIDVCKNHHDITHKDCSLYIKIVYIANCLLKRQGIGDNISGSIPENILEDLGLTEKDVELTLENMLEKFDSLGSLVNLLSNDN